METVFYNYSRLNQVRQAKSQRKKHKRASKKELTEEVQKKFFLIQWTTVLMAVENFTKLKKQEHCQGENEVDEEFDTFMKGCLLQAKLCTKITHIPVSDSGYSLNWHGI